MEQTISHRHFLFINKIPSRKTTNLRVFYYYYYLKDCFCLSNNFIAGWLGVYDKIMIQWKFEEKDLKNFFTLFSSSSATFWKKKKWYKNIHKKILNNIFYSKVSFMLWWRLFKAVIILCNVFTVIFSY